MRENCCHKPSVFVCIFVLDNGFNYRYFHGIMKEVTQAFNTSTHIHLCGCLLLTQICGITHLCDAYINNSCVELFI